MSKDDWMIDVVEKYCCNEVTQYQITSTDGKPEARTFYGGCHIQTGKLAAAIRKELKARMPKKKKLDDRFKWTWQYALNKKYNAALSDVEEYLND